MAQAWTVPTKDDVQKFMSVAVVGAANARDASGNDRVDGVLSAVVGRVRGACDASRRVPLSLTASSVPPQAVQHVLVLVVQAMAAATPQLLAYVESDGFKRQVEQAEAWIKRAEEEGTNFSTPTDPDPAGPAGGAWGDYRGEGTDETVPINMSTDTVSE